MNTSTPEFAEALEYVERLPVEDQAALVELVNKRVAALRRREMIQEIQDARADFAAGNVKRGSVSALMAELRAK